MFLKSLELNGFKSFGQKTTFDFPRGITAVVGPNGSGKSNIIDAIRWLLGERDAKNLRGAKAEDLIWNGSPKRPRLSMAQASLHFDNESGFFPVDLSEVAVSRRLSRDGESEYLLNKAEVRLKDVVDFLSRARLGTKGLIIIGQGSSDLFVRVSPEERRIMIEEILGLREFQLKKAEAERKLKSTFFNLEKAKAMIEEVVPRLRLLKRQTGKWEKRQAIADELRDVENNYFGKALHGLEIALRKLVPALSSIEENHAKKKKEIVNLETRLKEVEAEGDTRGAWKEIQQKKTDFFSKRREMEQSLARLEVRMEIAVIEKPLQGEIDFKALVSEIRDLLKEAQNGNDFSRLQSLVRKALSRIEEALESRVPPASKKEINPKLKKEKDELTGQLKNIEAQINALQKEEEKISSDMETFNDRFRNAFEALESKKEEVRKLEGEKNRILFEREKVELKIKEIERQIEQIGRTPEEFGAPWDPASEDTGDIERKMFNLRTELAAIGEIDEALIKEAREVEEHYEFLTAQSKDLETASEDLKNLIKELAKKIHDEFAVSLGRINEEFGSFFKLMFGGGSAKLKMKEYELRTRVNQGEEEEQEEKKTEEEGERETRSGIEIELSLPKKRIKNLDMLSGGEKSLVSIAALFALISVSPPPFLVLDEIDAPLDESNSRRFAKLLREFSKKTQFIVVTHNRATMGAADALYGITIGDDGCSKVLSVKLEDAAGKA